MEEHCTSQRRKSWRYADDRPSYRGLTSPPGYYEDEQRHNTQQLEMERRQRKRSKSRPKHCPSCHCILGARAKHSDNMEAVLENYQNYLAEPNNQLRSCNCNHMMEGDYHHSKIKETNSYPYPPKPPYNPNFFTTMDNMVALKKNESADSCTHWQSMKNNYKKYARCKESQAPVYKVLGNLNVDNESTIKSMQPKKERQPPTLPSPKPRSWKQYTEKANRLNGNGKIDLKGNEDENWLQAMKHNEVIRGKLRFDLSECDNTDNINAMEDREELGKRKLDGLPKGLSTVMQSNMAMHTTIQTSLKSKHVEAMPKHKSLAMDDSDCSKVEDTRKQIDNTRVYKSRHRSTIGKNSMYKPEEELMRTKEKQHAIACDEMIVRDDDQETILRKNGGGDLDLHATKSHILSLIDRALSNEFGNSIDQQKNVDSCRELTQREICIEITRDLLGDCCQVEDLLSQRGTKAECVKKLKNLWWKHMDQIQDEFKKLCDVQKYLDSFSPRQSVTAMQQPLTTTIEQRTEERQQQQEEKQSLGTIP